MADENILVIGAGAAGLMAARELAKAGKRVTVLEAKEKCGGRILDIPSGDDTTPFMLGAEFIHGDAAITLSLLQEAGIEYQLIAGENYSIEAGKVAKFESDRDFWPELMDKLEDLKNDMSLSSFLDLHFHDEKYNTFRESVLRYVQGYDAADADKVSVLSLKQEWSQNDEEHQYRIKGGYSSLLKWLEQDCAAAGALIIPQKVVSHFNWSRGFVEAITVEGERYAGKKAVITLPLGVLQNKDGSLGQVNFTPPLPIRLGAVREMGFGSVIKVIFQFKEAFWPADAGFIFSKEAFPVWWTQNPDPIHVLTGWLAGPAVDRYQGKSESELLDIALNSLSSIFAVEKTQLKETVVQSVVSNWSNNPFSRGAYTYTTINEPNAAAVLGNPVQGTLYFSGEATYKGPSLGTVEAALVSGKEAAERILTAVE